MARTRDEPGSAQKLSVREAAKVLGISASSYCRLRDGHEGQGASGVAG
jgi:hypothetical protein